jgi:predicted nuclease of predicted toxin-antitoxin system
VKSQSLFKALSLTGILVDENVPNNVREWLKKKGFDITNVSETDLKRAKDYAIAEYAAKNKMTILTLDTDFGQIYHTLKKGTLSVIVIKANPATASNILQTLMAGSKKVDLQKIEKKLVIISNKRIRIIA